MVSAVGGNAEIAMLRTGGRVSSIRSTFRIQRYGGKTFVFGGRVGFAPPQQARMAVWTGDGAGIAPSRPDTYIGHVYGALGVFGVFRADSGCCGAIPLGAIGLIRTDLNLPSAILSASQPWWLSVAGDGYSATDFEVFTRDERDFVKHIYPPQ